MYWYKKFLNYFKKIFTSFFIRISLTLSKLDNIFFKNSKDNDYTGNSNEIRNIQNDILKSLYNGEYNKEYIEKFYEILKRADQIVYEKHHFSNEDYYKKTNMDDSKDVTIVDMVTNKVEIKNTEDILLGSTPIKISTLKSRDKERIFKIEEICDFLHVKKYNDNELYLLEFYINIIHNSEHFDEEIKRLSNIYYFDKYGEKLEYNNLIYYKKNKFNYYNVYKFIGKKIN